MSEWISVERGKPKRQHWTECGSLWVKAKRDGKTIKDIVQYDHDSGRWRDRELCYVDGITHWKYFGK